MKSLVQYIHESKDVTINSKKEVKAFFAKHALPADTGAYYVYQDKYDSNPKLYKADKVDAAIKNVENLFDKDYIDKVLVVKKEKKSSIDNEIYTKLFFEPIHTKEEQERKEKEAKSSKKEIEDAISKEYKQGKYNGD